MRSTTPPAGAMPVAVGAMPTQSYPTGPVWAAYRLPFPGAIGARELGVCFEGEAGAATAPAAPPATPTPPAVPPASPVTPATGDPELGEAGKKAIAAERKAARDAQDALKLATDELTALKAAGLSDSEKAIKEATNAATAAERARNQSIMRELRVETALKVAGATNETLIGLALKSDLVVALKVDDAGKVTDLDKAVEQLKKDIPEMFAASGPGTVTRGVQTAPGTAAKTLEEAVAGHYSAKH